MLVTSEFQSMAENQSSDAKGTSAFAFIIRAHGLQPQTRLDVRTIRRWNAGTLERWNDGTLERWNAGREELGSTRQQEPELDKRGRQAGYLHTRSREEVQTIWEGVTIIQVGNTQRSGVKVSATRGEVSFKIKEQRPKGPCGTAKRPHDEAINR